MSGTISCLVVRREGVCSTASLFVGLRANRPGEASARYGLENVDRVELGSSDHRRAIRYCVGHSKVLGLSFADEYTSAQHVRIVRVDGQWILEDIGSRNGTWIGANRIERHVLRDRDVFMVGQTLLVFRTTGGELEDLEHMPEVARGLATLSPVLEERFARLEAASASGVTIEITGESGTGKELVARSVHLMSRRAGRFVAVNCGALPAHLVEAELFGHKKGAFTGAGEERIGLVRSADRGTLFLDEVGELPHAAQSSLLRVLQEHEVVPVGSDRAIAVDLRIVTATHRDLDADVSNHRFRADLRGRLLGVQIDLLSLRDRPEDIGRLVATLLETLAPDRRVTFAPDAAAALYAYPWPLNIRELERAIAAALAVSSERIELVHLPLKLRSTAPVASVEPLVATSETKDLRATLVAALVEHGGNVAAVARDLGKDRTQIRRWMRRFGLHRPAQL